MKHTINLQSDEQLNLIMKGLDVLVKLHLGQWHYATRSVFPWGEGLEVMKPEYRALITLIQSIGKLHPNKISMRSKKLNNEVRNAFDMFQILRHHTYNLKSKEERKVEPEGKYVRKFSTLEPITIEVTKDT